MNLLAATEREPKCQASSKLRHSKLPALMVRCRPAPRNGGQDPEQSCARSPRQGTQHQLHAGIERGGGSWRRQMTTTR
jgi:hypothetical protein